MNAIELAIPLMTDNQLWTAEQNAWNKLSAMMDKHQKERNELEERWSILRNAAMERLNKKQTELVTP